MSIARYGPVEEFEQALAFRMAPESMPEAEWAHTDAPLFNMGGAK